MFYVNTAGRIMLDVLIKRCKAILTEVMQEVWCKIRAGEAASYSMALGVGFFHKSK
jgi:hypothetical protein